jgi:hypothetical protein
MLDDKGTVPRYIQTIIDTIKYNHTANGID